MLIENCTSNVEAALDLVLINSLPTVADSETSLICVTSRWCSPDSIKIGRDYVSLMNQHPDALEVTEDEGWGIAKKVVWPREKSGESIGAYYCEGKFKDQVRRILTMKMQQTASFLPEALTITANKGELVNIPFSRTVVKEEDAVIYKNGTFIYSVLKHEVPPVLQVPLTPVQLSDAGVYSARYIGGSHFTSAYTRLIVRRCEAQKWGPECNSPCPDCQNSGICHEDTGGCICPPGFMGKTCEKGAPDESPQIVNLPSTVELNSGSEFKSTCIVTGKPLPTEGEITLIKKDGSVLQPITVANRSNRSEATEATFHIENVQPSDSGIWVYSVETVAGMVEKLVHVTVKVLPVPQKEPTLVERGHNFLTIATNADSYSGDGPIVSTKILYKSAKSPWKSEEVTEKTKRLDHLEPNTEYFFCVRLTRRGEGGTGHPGPTGSFTTAAVGIPPSPDNVKIMNVTDSSAIISWSTAEGHSISSIILSCNINGKTEYNQIDVTIRNTTITQYHLKGLEPNSEYQVQIKARNNVGLSTPSPSYDLKTLPETKGLDSAEPDTWAGTVERGRHSPTSRPGLCYASQVGPLIHNQIVDEGRFIVDRPGIKQQHRQAQGAVDKPTWNPPAGGITRRGNKCQPCVPPSSAMTH
ncbi:Angiopoietin-1 receptor [Varanus komodoensis]|nr:Angiopoietin-1 receptor [Varanus komodoensis]